MVATPSLSGGHTRTIERVLSELTLANQSMRSKEEVRVDDSQLNAHPM